MRIDYELANISGKEQALSEQFDLFIYAIGYEKRASFVRSCEPASLNYLAIDYLCANKGAYNANLAESEKHEDTAIAYKGREVSDSLTKVLDQLFDDGKRPHKRIGLDISCLDRTLMSYVMVCLLNYLSKRDTITFLYTPSKFVEPELYLTPLKRFAPAIPELSGMVGNPYKNRALIMGLGYEYGAALNVLNILEPQFSQIYYPIGDDPRFLPHVKSANFEFEFGLSNYNVSSYQLNDAVTMHGQMRDMIYSLLPNFTIMIVPFGPKLFSALGILLCINNDKDCSFMRYSVQEPEEIPLIESSDKIHGFNLKMV